MYNRKWSKKIELLQAHGGEKAAEFLSPPPLTLLQIIY
jgi:hypothetical protein